MAKCSDVKCAEVTGNPDSVCHQDGMAGQVIYVVDGNTRCYCVCSCLFYGTPVAISETNWKRIEEFVPGDEVLVYQLDKSWKSMEVAWSYGMKPISIRGKTRPVIYVQTVTDLLLLVTPDHVFLLPNGQLIKAGSLLPEDAFVVQNPAIQLVDENGLPINLKLVARGRTTQGIHNISTTPIEEAGDSIENHLINTAGVISGDFYAQLYLAKDALLGQPSILNESSLVNQTQVRFTAETDVGGLDLAQFIPSNPTKFIPPPGAASLLPEYMQTAKPGFLNPLSDEVPLEIAEYLVNHFKRFYSDVVYEIHWEDDTVNAYAWKEGNERHVALLGGLIRHKSIKKEGVGLVLAHELGHHYGRVPPKTGGDLACEGEADWWGANVGMRIVWWGEEYIDQLLAGADQLYDLFANGLVKTITDGEEKKLFALSSCSVHPPADCRKETYLAAVRGEQKPDCAGAP